jgi:hypothetical protein
MSDISSLTPRDSVYVIFIDLAKSPAPESKSLNILRIIVKVPKAKLAELNKPSLAWVAYIL